MSRLYAGSKWVVPRRLLATSSLSTNVLSAFLLSKHVFISRVIGIHSIKGERLSYMGNVVQQDILQQLEQLRKDASAALAQADTAEAMREWHTEYLGRKGRLTAILRNLGSLPGEERPLVGKVANEVKDALENALQERQAASAQAELEAVRRAESVDVTLPGRPQNLGKLHITTRTLREIHAMREYATEPIRVILPGKVYRYEAVDASHESMFYQVEGLAVGKHITFCDLKGVLVDFANQMYGEGRKSRFRKSYFPFTEPSVEMDIECVLCNGQGCPVCKYTGWLEILGAGMVHPRVLENGGYDPTEFSGFAFGMGPDRIALQKYSIDDIRYFYTNDMRLLERI